MEQIDIEPLQVAELGDAAEVAGRAMAPTPFPTAILRGRQDKERCMAMLFGVTFERLPGQTIIAKKDDRIVGVMRMVEWPRCQLKPFEALRIMPTMLIALRGAAIRGLKGRSAWSKHDPKVPHWHLDPLTVVPERQGQGIGSQLLRYFCDQVDKTGLAAYLETDRPENVRLYERFGWQIKEEETVLGVHCWFMWRPAKNRPI